MRLVSAHASRFDPSSIRLPLIALIDVVLFLLFYFVISYSIAADEADLSTGFAQAGPSETLTEPQILLVSQAGDRTEYRIGLRTFGERDALTALLRSLPKDPGLVVRAAPNTPIAATASAVQAGKDAGFTSVRFAIGSAADAP